MQRCSPKAYAMCPDRKYCGTIEDAVFTNNSECAAFNREVEGKPLTNADHTRVMSMSVVDQLRKEWISEAKKRGLFMDDLISRKAVHDNIGELELFASLTDEDIREHDLYVDENGEFYFTEEQGRIASVMYVLMRRYINEFPVAKMEPEE